MFISKKVCVDCGKNPVPHFLYWYFESLNILLGPIRRCLLQNPIAIWFWGVGKKFQLAFIFLKLGQALGFVKIRGEINLCKVERAKVLWEEATRRGIKMQELLLLGKPFDTYIADSNQLSANQHRLIFSGLPRPANYNNSALDWMDDKWLLKKKFIQENLPVPKGGTALTFKQAKQLFDQIYKPVIVKPRAGSRGRHTSIFVKDLKQLQVAYNLAKQLCAWVIVEEQVMGPVYRATVINYELCGVLRGDPPSVVGNGEQTIFELAEQKNNTALPQVKPMVLDSSVEKFLNLQQLSLTTILPCGQQVNLSEKVGVNYGGSSAEEYDICHPATKALFETASKVLNEPIVGFDFIIEDITKSYTEQRCGFIEANSLPFINLHHSPLFGTPRNIAKKIWDMVGF